MITVALLALLVLAVFALSSLVRVGTQAVGSSAYQTQARRNALLALSVALGELQRAAGPDARVTGIAGITGIAPNANNTTRHWCGVWRNDGSFVGWLTSGAQSQAPALSAGVSAIELAGQNTLGATFANSEHVIAGKIPIAGAGIDANFSGNYAFLVLDEGVKTSLYAPSPAATAPVIFANTTNAQSRLRDAVATYAAALPGLFSYEQVAVIPTPAAALTASTLQDNFHHTTLTARWVNNTSLQTGYVNVNTNSVIVWRNLLQTYNASPAAPAQIAAGTLSTRGTSLQNNVAAFSTAGKVANGPFTSTAAAAALLASVFTSGSPTAVQINTVVAPMLAVRSDTFRIRAYGEATNPLDGSTLEGTAYCEAIVQRTTETAPAGLGRRFVITYFRWLGPDDI
ncbi:MAG: hypothetical protein HZA32_12775 [Opitutae bacterium]|nr:hypothetical protein [Opitutae bacterium]